MRVVRDGSRGKPTHSKAHNMLCPLFYQKDGRFSHLRRDGARRASVSSKRTLRRSRAAAHAQAVGASRSSVRIQDTLARRASPRREGERTSRLFGKRADKCENLHMGGIAYKGPSSRKASRVGGSLAARSATTTHKKGTGSHSLVQRALCMGSLDAVGRGGAVGRWDGGTRWDAVGRGGTVSRRICTWVGPRARVALR